MRVYTHRKVNMSIPRSHRRKRGRQDSRPVGIKEYMDVLELRPRARQHSSKKPVVLVERLAPPEA